MLINASMRCDIPAFFAPWFLERIREGYVLVRSPYDPARVSRYQLDPKVVDAISFCTKNPAPLLDHLSLLASFRQYWFVTITPYGRDIEPFVPEKREVINSVKRLALAVGRKAVVWLYDPILITPTYSVSYHLRAFMRMCALLQGSCEAVVVSFLDLYPKTTRNFPEAQEVPEAWQQQLIQAMVPIARRYHMVLRLCHEHQGLGRFGADVRGCMTKDILEEALGLSLNPPKRTGVRKGCACLLGGDIGSYGCCPHLCAYCYANENKARVVERFSLHDPSSPLLIGHLQPSDQVHQVVQHSWIDGQPGLGL